MRQRWAGDGDGVGERFLIGKNACAKKINPLPGWVAGMVRGPFRVQPTGRWLGLTKSQNDIHQEH